MCIKRAALSRPSYFIPWTLFYSISSIDRYIEFLRLPVVWEPLTAGRCSPPPVWTITMANGFPSFMATDYWCHLLSNQMIADKSVPSISACLHLVYNREGHRASCQPLDSNPALGLPDPLSTLSNHWKAFIATLAWSSILITMKLVPRCIPRWLGTSNRYFRNLSYQYFLSPPEAQSYNLPFTSS